MKTIARLGIACAIISAGFAVEPAPVPDFVPCRVHRRVQAVYPLRMLEQGVTHGDATIVVEVDSSGRVADQLITAYSHPEFAYEARRTVDEWKFEPGRVKGERVVCILTINFEFTVDGIAVYERRMDTIQTDEYAARKYAYFAHGPTTLDQRPVAIRNDQPIYPRAWIQEGRRGVVRVRFYIDETGRTRLPVIVDGSDDYLANAAVAAVKEWRFKKPMVAGKPVLAYAEQLFVFEPPKLAENP